VSPSHFSFLATATPGAVPSFSAVTDYAPSAGSDGQEARV
jgi:hypothetical protein